MPKSTQPEQNGYSSLGEYLRETRISLGLDLEAVAGETKISARSLHAIEENDFSSLPAEAFTRGFYALYAKYLALQPEEILRIYSEQRPKSKKLLNTVMLPTGKIAQEVGNMAKRPSFAPFSLLGLFLLLLLLFGGLLCWYFSWNPATYLSQKLRSLEKPVTVEQASSHDLKVIDQEPKSQFAKLINRRAQNNHFFDISYPTSATAAIYRGVPTSLERENKIVGNYILSATFSGQTEIKLAIDNQAEQTFLFKAGDSATWTANEKAVITLPAKAQAKLTFNNTPFNLPDTGKKAIKLTFPNHSQQ